MFGRHITKGFSWVLVIALLLTSVTIAAAQPGDENPGKPPAPPEEPISQTPDVDPRLLDGDASEPATRAVSGAAPMWNWVGNFTVSGNLGVGTEAPTARINVIGNTNGTTGIRVDNTNAGVSALTSLNIRTGTNRGVQLQKFGSAYNVPWNGLSMANWARLRADSATAGMMVGTGGPYPLVFGTGDVERARVTPAGNLQLGTRSAAEDTHRLTVRFSGDDNAVRVIGPDPFGSGARVNFGDSDYVYLDEDIDDSLTIYAASRTALMGGPVGVGTTNPNGGKLHVSTSTGTAVYGTASATSGLTYGVKGQVNNTSGSGVSGFQPGYSASDIPGSLWMPGGLFGGRNGVIGISKVNDGVGVEGTSIGSTGLRRGVEGYVSGTGWGLYTYNDLYVGGNCTGCAMAYIAHNASQDTLKVGDVVAVRGVSAALEGQEKPVLEVAPATGTDTWVLGVVSMRGELIKASAENLLHGDGIQPTEGDAAPGDYLLVVTSGMAQVRIGQKDALVPGAALTVSDVSGSARAADGAATLVLGRALEAQPNENGLIWAMVETQ